MKRFKTIDTLRGVSIMWMILGHLTEWWILNEEVWFFNLLRSIGDPLGSGAFLFIAGVSTALSYQKNLSKINKYNPNGNNYLKLYRKEYMFRAFIILIVALIYNSLTAITMNDPTQIWTWFILLTVSISLFLGWPLLKTSKIFRIYLGLFLWFISFILINFLSEFEGQMNIFGVSFHILYNRADLDPLLSFFPFFIIGTIVGELVFEIFQIEDQKKRFCILKNKLLIPGLVSGLLLIFFGIAFNFPNFLQHRTFSWLFYSLGIELILIASLLTLEELVVFSHKRNLKFIYYFSYYSLSLYLLHYLLFFLFQNSLDYFFVLIYSILILIFLGFVLRIIHLKIGAHFSLKFQIGRLSRALAKRI